jgi:carboxypeptidase Taq
MASDARYDELVALVREEALLSSVSATLEWDEDTAMPDAGVANRARQQALLAGLVHERATHPRRGELLEALAGVSLAPDEAINLRELRVQYDRDRKVPRSLAEALASEISLAAVAWSDARDRRDLAPFAPHLARIFELKRAEAQCLSSGDLYDALLDDHESGMSMRMLAPILDALARELPPLIDRARGARDRIDPAILRGDFPELAQRELCEWLAEAVGYDFAGGRLDGAIHPFTIGLGPGDCRITARWDETNLTEGIFTTLHEAGHALYEQGLDVDQWGLPCGMQVSDAIDESQSRLWENVVGRSPGFWRFLWPELGRRFPALASRDRDAYLRAVCRVEPSPIRARADELTYHLHILIRIEIERALLAGDLAIADLPAAWDERYRQLLGLTPRDVTEGCLQDGHWSAGLVGYFPTYTLGDVYAAALAGAAARELGELDDLFARGETAPLREWLRTRVHRVGCRLAAHELIEAAGQAPSADALLARLRARLDWLDAG